MRTPFPATAKRIVDSRRGAIAVAEIALSFLIILGGVGAARGQVPNLFDPPTTQIAAGDSSTCALTAAGAVECWGDITLPLGIASDVSSVPVPVNGLSDVVAISTGSDHLCALTKAGGVQCIGANASGQLGNGLTADSHIPVAVKGLDKGVAAIAAGRDFSCALTTAGAVWCWGNNEIGQLGNNSRASSPSPVPVSGLDSGVMAISLGPASSHACALTAAGAVKCWGINNEGELGNDSTDSSSVPVMAKGLSSGVAAISVGEEHTCAVTRAGAALCWGLNYRGELGTGSTTESHVPAAVSGLNSGVAAIAAGDYHTCALTAAGAALCWGEGTLGELGNGQSGSSYIPVLVAGLSTTLTSITAGRFHTCALSPAGAVLCWGDGGSGQLGNGSFTISSSPAGVAGLNGVVTAVALSLSNSCILTQDGGVQCRGSNDSGILGNGGDSAEFVRIRGLSGGATAITVGSEFACALIQGNVQCWGENGAGELGNGSLQNSSVPVSVVGLNRITAISSGYSHSCALDSDGGVHCWGNWALGALGSPGQSTGPVSVTGLSSGATAVAAGAYFSCAVAGGGVLCWGSNSDGQLGNDSTTDSAVPVSVKGLSDIKQTALGGAFACALSNAGAVWCWGANDHGQLGNNSTVASHVPVRVGGLSDDVVAIATGGAYACALTAAGAVRCWGAHWGLGVGTTDDSLVPVATLNGDTAIAAISAGMDASTICELTVAGELACWGVNYKHIYDSLNSDSLTPFIPSFSQSLSFSTPTSLAPGATLSLKPIAVATTSRGCGYLQVGAATCPGTNDFQPITFDTWTPDTCTVSGTTLTVAGKASGLCGVRASQSGGPDGTGFFVNSTFTPAPQQLRLIQIQAGPAASTTTLTPSAASGVYGQSVTFTATVSGSAPSGNVVFSDGTTVLCTTALSGGGDSPTAACSTMALAVGTHNITAAYAGDTNNAASTSDPALGYSVAQATTTVGVTLSSNKIFLGDSVNVVAAVSVTAPGGGTPTGTITVQIRDETSCSYSLAAAQPGCSITPKLGGYVDEPVNVSYSGDANFVASTGTATLTVAFSSATVSVTSSANPSLVGQTVSFSAQVTWQGPVAVPGPGRGVESVSRAAGITLGTITISDGATVLASLTPDALNESLTYSTSSLAAGSHMIIATYSGDSLEGPGSATLVQQVNTSAASSSVALSSSLNPSTSGQTVTFTATVSASAAAAAVPTGTVTLSDNGAVLASVALGANGQAVYSTSTLATGSHTITVNYSGDATTAPASSTLVQQVGAAAPVVSAPALSPMALLLLGFGFVGLAGYGVARVPTRRR